MKKTSTARYIKLNYKAVEILTHIERQTKQKQTTYPDNVLNKVFIGAPQYELFQLQLFHHEYKNLVHLQKRLITVDWFALYLSHVILFDH